MASKKQTASATNGVRSNGNLRESPSLISLLPHSPSSPIHTIRKQLREREVMLTTGMNFAEQSGYVTWDFNTKPFDTLELLHITDVQFGHVFCDVRRVIEYRDWVLDKPNRFMLWGGDMIDAGTKLSVGSPWEQLWEPQGQIYRFCDLWAPAAHRVLGYVGGNHEQRGVPTFGDLGTLLASMLDIPYSLTQQRVDLRFGARTDDPFSARLWHGSGSSSTAGAKMQMLDRLMTRGDNDLYLTGHLHDAMTKFKWREIRDPRNQSVKLKKIGGAMSSSFLSYWHTYAEAKNLEPNGLMMARVILERDGGWELTLR